MAKLPGLARFDDDAIRSRSGGTPSKSRVVTNPQVRSAPGLRPTASPVDPYARPTQAPQDNTVRDLAESLASLNPALMRYAEVTKATKDETLSARVAQKYAGKTYEEQQELYKTDADAQTLLGMRAIGAHMGRGQAQALGRQALEFYETEFDKDGGDLDGYLNGVMRQAIEAHPEDPFFAEHFAEVFNPISAQLRAQHATYKVGAVQTKVAETIHNSWLGTVNAGIIQGKDATSIANELRDSYLTNREGMKISYADQDKAAVGVMQQLALQIDQEPGNAEKLFDVLNAMAMNPRTAADGTKLGRLLDSGSLGPDVAKIISAAQTKVAEQRELSNLRTLDGFHQAADNGNLDQEELDAFFNDPKNKGVMTVAQRQSFLSRDYNAKQAAAAGLLKEQAKEEAKLAEEAVYQDAVAASDSGSISSLTDRRVINASGAEVVITVDQQQKEITRRYLEREARVTAADKRPPEVVQAESFNRQARLFSESGLEHPQWKQALKSGVSSMTSAQEATKITEATSKGFDLYRSLNAKSPNYLRTLMTSDEANVYETARILMESGSATKDEALIAAQRYYSDPTRSSSVTAGMKSKEITAAVQSQNGRGWFSDEGVAGGFENPEVLNGETQKLAEALVGAGGMSPDQAVEKAAQTVAKGYTSVNGWAVKTADRAVPADFGDYATRFLRNWHTDNGDLNGLDMDELTLAAIPNTRDGWRVVRKDTGLPVIMDDPTAGIFRMQDIAAMKQHDRDAEEARIIEENRTRNDPVVDLGWLKIGKPKWFWSKEDTNAFKAK